MTSYMIVYDVVYDRLRCRTTASFNQGTMQWRIQDFKKGGSNFDRKTCANKFAYAGG